MGLYDTILYNCPKCKDGIGEFQTKVLDNPIMRTFHLHYPNELEELTKDELIRLKEDILESDEYCFECNKCGYHFNPYKKLIDENEKKKFRNSW